MRVFFVGRNYSQGVKDSDPTSLLEVARLLGIEPVRSVDENPNFLICVDFVSHVLPDIRKASGLGIPTVLIINEPTVVVPQHSDSRVLRAFDKVIRVGRPNDFPVLKWPQTWREPQVEVKREKKAVVINADKWSFVSGQLYWLRASISAKSDDVIVYGHGWNRNIFVRLSHRAYELLRTIKSGVIPNLKGLIFLASTPRLYLGTVQDKIATMSKYKVALVIENSQELMTEKLFDAWFAGCVPVYVGPPLAPFGIPESLVIRCEEPTIAALDLAIKRALETDHSAFAKEVRSFLDVPESQAWRAADAIAQVLKEALQTNSAK